MSTTTLKAEIKILMPFFKIPVSEFNNLIKIHGGVKEAHTHLAKMFDDRKANKN